MPTLAGSLSELDWTTPAQQEAVIQIMHFYGCFPDGSPSSPTKLLDRDEVLLKAREDIDVTKINSLMQEHLKRRVGSERAMLGMDERLVTDKDLFSQLTARYDALGMIQAIKPSAGTVYDAILLLGSTETSFRQRLDSLIKFEREDGITGPIYLLGSDRELWPIDEPIMAEMLAERTAKTVEEINDYFISVLTREFTLEEVKTKSAILNAARAEIYAKFRDDGIAIPTEADMMDWVVDNSELKKVSHTKIQAGKRSDGSRANTEDTIIKFDEHYSTANPEKTDVKILVISTQPEALYQIEPVKKILTPTKGYNGLIDIAAEPKVSVNPLVANDAIARRVYSRLERLKTISVEVGVGVGDTIVPLATVGGGGEGASAVSTAGPAGHMARELARRDNSTGESKARER